MARKRKKVNRLKLSDQERPFRSITYGRVTKEEMFEIIAKRIREGNSNYSLYVGTDSQVHDGTKVVTVVAVVEEGKGGFWFNTIDWSKRFSKEQIRVKIYDETMRSINMAKELTTFLYENDLDFEVVIHVDLGEGKKSKTRDMIAEITGWVTAEGFTCYHKPQSFVASTIADRISK